MRDADIEQRNYGKCVLTRECKTNECDNPTFIIPGYSEDLRIAQFNAMWFESENRRKYECYLPFSKCEYDLNCIADSLYDEIQRNEPNQKVDLAGMSFGGMIAEIYARKYPEKVNKLVLITSFSKIHPSIMKFRELGDLKNFLDNIKKFDFDEVVKNRIGIPTLEYNCFLDKLVGDPPNVPHAEKHIDYFCTHGHIGMTNALRNEMKKFIEKYI